MSLPGVDHGDRAAGRTAAPTPGRQAAAARAAVIRALTQCDDALGAWEAGSAAFGRADLTSDLDVGVLCRDGRGRQVLDAIERELRRVEPDLDAWDVGASPFGVQRFWQPAARSHVAATCMVDVSAIEHDGQADKWAELLTPERHGRALAMFDPAGVLADAMASVQFDPAAHRARIATELDRIRGRRTMFAAFPAKELDRGRTLDALGMHHGMVVAPLVSLLGMVHRPLRFDFGMRYLHEELPADVVERLVPIVGVDADTLGERGRDGVAWIDELLDVIDPERLPLESHAAQMRASFAT